MNEETKEQFNQLAVTGTWPSRYDPSDIRNYNFITRRESVQRILKGDRFKSTLDLGCGTGDYCDVLSAVSSEYVGVDFSAAMIQRATLAHGTSDPSGGPLFLEGSAESLPFGENRFDLVCAIGFIEYFDDPAQPMREIVRVLKPGGTLVIQSFQNDCFRKVSTATGMDAVKRSVKAFYGAITHNPASTGFSTDHAYSQHELDALMKRFQFVKTAHLYSNYLVLPKTIRRIVPHANVLGSETLTRYQPRLFRGFAVNYVGRYTRASIR